MRSLACAALAAFLLAAPASLAQRAPSPGEGAASQGLPVPADVLFEAPHWKNAAPGTTLTYRYKRETGVPDAFGPSFEDRIRLTLEGSEKAESRTVRTEMFTGPRRQPAGPFEDTSGNPVLSLFLQHHLETLSRALSANPRYLKNGIRAGLRNKATIAPTTVAFDGRSVPGWRVEVRPFAGDANQPRMRGLETLTYTFVTADAVPGTIVSLEVKATDADGGRVLEESLTYDPNAG